MRTARKRRRPRRRAHARPSCGRCEAPPALRARIEAEPRAPGGPAVAPRRLGRRGGRRRRVAALAAALVVVLAPASPPTVLDAAALAARGPEGPAPARDPADPDALARGVEGSPSPPGPASVAWRATGERSDTLDGRRAATVYYAGPGGGAPRVHDRRRRPRSTGPTGARRAVRRGVEVCLLRRPGAVVATWREARAPVRHLGPGLGLRRGASWRSPRAPAGRRPRARRRPTAPPRPRPAESRRPGRARLPPDGRRRESWPERRATFGRYPLPTGDLGPRELSLTGSSQGWKIALPWRYGEFRASPLRGSKRACGRPIARAARGYPAPLRPSRRARPVDRLPGGRTRLRVAAARGLPRRWRTPRGPLRRPLGLLPRPSPLPLPDRRPRPLHGVAWRRSAAPSASRRSCRSTRTSSGCSPSAGDELDGAVVVGPDARQYATLCDKLELTRPPRPSGSTSPRRCSWTRGGPTGPGPRCPRSSSPRPPAPRRRSRWPWRRPPSATPTSPSWSPTGTPRSSRSGSSDRAG